MQYDSRHRLGAIDGTPFLCNRRDDFSKDAFALCCTLSSQALFCATAACTFSVTMDMWQHDRHRQLRYLYFAVYIWCQDID